MERVVLVHGLWLGGYCFGSLRRRLRAMDVDAECFEYSTTRSTLSAHAEALRRFLDERPGVPVIAHSLGCLVTLAALRPNDPRRAVLMGPPLRGSFVARRVSQLGLGRLLLGEVGRDLRRGFAHGVTDNVGVIAGSKRMGLGTLIGGLSRPGDGTVSLEETRSTRLRHHITLPVSHTSMLFSKMVAERAMAFVRTGHFDAAMLE